ncbi:MULTISPECIES: F0F1 ATP synthase subunit B [Candidatus Ichthyocystis]|uniref:ATP synthase subunit b n=1 Tax=Candidatus Ichthyocystis hellenicum TaxID=1561003 RepID=A0A0S4M319_9BURK|nr:MULTISPECIES: F0F1 ATP synthase subunit B [Ichthyocystis]CUT17130.1 ATP synthase subunit B [Candidatus Ichthyocystis hellenicum]
MNLNATLFVQCLVFFGLAWFTMRFVWPPISKVLDERSERISRGLADAEAASVELSDARETARDQIGQAKLAAREITRQAEMQASDILVRAQEEASAIVARAQNLADQAAVQAKRKAKEELMKDFSSLVFDATKAVLLREVDIDVHRDILDQMIYRDKFDEK